MKKALFFTVILIFACSFTAFARGSREAQVPEETPSEAVPEEIVQNGEIRQEESAAEGTAVVEAPITQEFLDFSIFIEGTAEREDHLETLISYFNIEAAGAGFPVSGVKEESPYTFSFLISLNEDKEFDFNDYVITISLIDNSNDEEILNFDFFFTEIDELYIYSRYLFEMATMYIAPDREIIKEVAAEIDRSWQRKWLYLSLSFNYPVTFFSLQPTGLYRGQAVYDAPGSNPDVQMLSHIIMPQPGLALGLEFQFLNFMSLEVNFQVNIGAPNTYRFFNFAVGALLKFSIKTPNFMIQPYGAFLYPINVSPEFSKFPRIVVGGGAQVNVRGGRLGAFFVDFNFMYSIGDVFRINPYLDKTIPENIHYKRFAIGLGIGYKFGFVNRRSR